MKAGNHAQGMKCLCAGYENEMKFAVHGQGMKKLCTVRKKNQSDSLAAKKPQASNIFSKIITWK
jgi:hypothetical protein